jgi:RNA polymerase sigma factor (sigma-70 family)
VLGCETGSDIRKPCSGPPAVEPTHPDASRWFLTEVQPHRPALRAWLLAHFPTLPDVDDVVQEAFAHVLQARETTAIRSTRALLFTTARNLALDTVRRQRIARFEPLPEGVDWSALEDQCDVVAVVSKQQELELLTLAMQSLPARSRQILTLRTAYGFTTTQIAEKLRISRSTVEKQMASSIRACARFFAERDRR